MAESLPPSGSHHPPPPPGAAGEDNEPRIDGDGQEVNALRFLGAGGPPAPPAPSITPVSSGVSQPMPAQHPQQPPAPPQTPHQHQPPSQSLPPQSLIPNTPGGNPYDPYSDPSGGVVGGGSYHPHANPMQIPTGPMSGPYGMAPGPPGAPPGMMAGGPMMMMPSAYAYGMYPSPYGFMPPAASHYAAPMAPQQPANSQTQFLAMLNVLRVNNPKYYREWYKKYTAHKRNPDRVPFPPIPQVPGFPQMPGAGVPGSSQTLPNYGRSRKGSTRGSVNGDIPYSRGGHPNDSFADYSLVPNASMSLDRSHHHRSHSGRTSVNGDYKNSVSVSGRLPPEDEFDIDGAAAGDMSSLSMTGHAGSNIMHSTFNHQHYPGGADSGSDRDRPQTQSGRSSTIGEPYRLPPGDIYGGGGVDQSENSLSRYDSGLYNNFQPITQTEQQREPSPIRRMTPLKFSTFHCIATMSPLGHMIRVKNSGTVLEFVKMKQFVGHLPEYREMEAFPGPLTQISTHKSTVIQFCKRKIKEARSNPAQIDRENYILLWELLMLMLRQNGMVVGSDIAELLLAAVQQQQHQQQLLLQQQQKQENVQKEEVRDTVEGSDGSLLGSSAGDDKEEGEGESSGEENDNKVPINLPLAADPSPLETATVSSPQEEKRLVEEFCEHLLYGHKKDALDFAMDHGLWGHALFFASKMDERSYGHVLARFANGIPLNSPLQTLYHIMCGKQPASVTNCGDIGVGAKEEETPTFGDWKPHLAMLLSNSGYKPEVEHRAILTLGDTLQAKGNYFAAQFCYLMGHDEFRKDSRMGSLLGYCPQKNNLLEATQMTEVYEFARKLADPGFSLGGSFLQSKLDHSKRLVSYGFVEEALAYCEEITKVLRQSRQNRGDEACDGAEELIKLCGNTLQIAERIAVADESGAASGTWVEDLRRMVNHGVSTFSQVEEDNSRKMSMLSGASTATTNQELSPGDPYSSTLPPPAQGGDGSSHMYDPYGGIPQQPTTGAPPPNVPMMPYTEDTSGMTMMMPGGGVPQQLDGSTAQLQGGGELQQQQTSDNNSWGQNPVMINGGLHISQPQQSSPHQQPSIYDPPQIPGVTNLPNYGQNDGSGYQQQQPGMDGGYPPSGGGFGDKQSMAPPNLNNNSYDSYNPYDSQPQLGLGGGNGSSQDYSNNPYLPPLNSSPVKKKCVRFEDEHQPSHPPQPAQSLMLEGNYVSSSTSIGVDGGGAVQSVVRSRFPHGSSAGGARSPQDPVDLKSALKTSSALIDRQQHQPRDRQSGGLVNGGGNSPSLPGGVLDLERCSKRDDKQSYFEVEYKSTYPIDEPILDSSLGVVRSPTSTAPPQTEGSTMRLVNSKKTNPNDTGHSNSLVCPPVHHHYSDHLIINHHLGNHTVNAHSNSGRKTYPVDKECCDVNQPCEDHGDLLDDGEIELEAEDEDDEEIDGDDGEEDDDEEGGGRRRCNRADNEDIEGLENGGTHYHHHPSSHQRPDTGLYTRFENKTENLKTPGNIGGVPSADKKGADKKKKEDKGGDKGGKQQQKGWFWQGWLGRKSDVNQMILPDDKNPTIVWDPKANRWVSSDADGDDDMAPAGPPPKDSELMGGKGGGMGGVPMMQNGPMPPQPQHQMMMQHQQQQLPPGRMVGGGQPQPQNNGGYQQQQPNSMPSSNPSQHQPGMMMMNQNGGNLGQDPMGGGGMVPMNNNNNSANKYKLQKGRGLKGYVDVFNPNANSNNTASSTPTPMQPNHQQSGGGNGGGPPVPNLFIPPPMPAGGGGADSGPVSFLTAPAVEENTVPGQQGQENSLGQTQPPPMFNPSQFQGYSQGQ